ncbi:MAG: type II secretion system minor pseudopilin GspI [Immundisolibacter sp.]
MRARGFTLLEVLVALLIVAITLSAATAAVGGAALRQRGLEERTFATWAAQNTLNRVRLNGLPGDRLEQRQALAGVNWRVDVQARTEHSMRRLELVVRRVGEAQPLARLTGFLPVPVPVQESEAQQPPMRVPGPEPEQPP